MQERAKLIYFVIITIALLGIATLVWAFQTNRISIKGASDNYTISNVVGYPGTATSNCSNVSVGNNGIMTGVGFSDMFECGRVDNTYISSMTNLPYMAGTNMCAQNQWMVGGLRSASGSGGNMYSMCATFEDSRGSMAHVTTGDTITVPSNSNNAECPANYAMTGFTPGNGTQGSPIGSVSNIYCSKLVDNSPSTPGPSTVRPDPFSMSSVTAVCDGSTNKYSINWQSSNYADSYMIYRNDSLIQSSITGTNFVDTFASAARYQIVANNAYGNRYASPVEGISANPGNCSSPTPTGTAPTTTFQLQSPATDRGAATGWTLTNTTSAYITMDKSVWDSNPDIASYGSCSGTTCRFNLGLQPEANTPGGVSMARSFSFPTPGTNYQMTIYATGPGGNANATLNITTAIGPTWPLPAPLNLTAQVLHLSDIKLDWTPVPNANIYTYYDVYNADTNIVLASVNTPTWTITGLKCATEYKYYVKARDDRNPSATSAASNTASATTMACVITADTEKPSTPGNLAIKMSSVGTDPSCNQLVLSWDKSTDNVGVVGYDIYSAADNKLITSTENNSYTFDKVLENTKLSYYVVARDAAKNVSDRSNTAETITSFCPKAPSTTSSSNVKKLVSTGSTLWFNILIALLISGLVSFFLFRKSADQQ